jgi:hypothetical protein
MVAILHALRLPVEHNLTGINVQDTHCKKEVLSLVLAFNNTFLVHGMYNMIWSVDKDTSDFLQQKVAPLDKYGLDTLKKAIRFGAQAMVAIKEGYNMIESFGKEDLVHACKEQMRANNRSIHSQESTQTLPEHALLAAAAAQPSFDALYSITGTNMSLEVSTK